MTDFGRRVFSSSSLLIVVAIIGIKRGGFAVPGLLAPACRARAGRPSGRCAGINSSEATFSSSAGPGQLRSHLVAPGPAPNPGGTGLHPADPRPRPCHRHGHKSGVHPSISAPAARGVPACCLATWPRRSTRATPRLPTPVSASTGTEFRQDSRGDHLLRQRSRRFAAAARAGYRLRPVPIIRARHTSLDGAPSLS